MASPLGCLVQNPQLRHQLELAALQKTQISRDTHTLCKAETHSLVGCTLSPLCSLIETIVLKGRHCTRLTSFLLLCFLALGCRCKFHSFDSLQLPIFSSDMSSSPCLALRFLSLLLTWKRFTDVANCYNGGIILLSYHWQYDSSATYRCACGLVISNGTSTRA
jgi:hypothetical protein